MKIIKQYKGENKSLEISLDIAKDELEIGGYWEENAIENIREESIEFNKDSFQMHTSFAIYTFTEIGY
jgi:hypothetical protein